MTHLSIYSPFRAAARRCRRSLWGAVGALCLLAAGALLAAGCSTTRRLPAGEVLYTGVERIRVTSAAPVPDSVQKAVDATLAVEPNNSLLGSTRRRWPLPLGLWMYDLLYTERTTGLRHWLFTALKSDPILVSQVNPGLRAKAAEIVQADAGYFGGRVTYDLIYRGRRRRRARVAYDVVYPEPYRIGRVQYMPTPVAEVNHILEAARAGSLLRPGAPFTAAALEGERRRLVGVLRGSGYYLYDERYVRLLADSTAARHRIDVRVYAAEGIADAGVLRRCVVDSVALTLDHGSGRPATRRDTFGPVSVAYRGRLRLRPAVIRSLVPFAPGEVYSDALTRRFKSRVARLQTFKYSAVTYTPLPPDSLSAADSVCRLRLDLSATYAYPYTGRFELRAVTKDNHQTGPGLALRVDRRNCFGGGELLSLEAAAGYEWVTGRHARTPGAKGLVNSYEFGLKTSLAVPRLLLPRGVRFDPDYPVSTTFSLSADMMRRSGYFQMLKAGIEVRYDFYQGEVSRHSFSPLLLTYTTMMHTSARFDSIVGANKVLRQGFTDRFIPAMAYTYLLDNRELHRTHLTQQWFQFTLTEAGGLIGAVESFTSSRPQGERRLLWQPYSQFLKATADLRNYFRLTSRLTLAMRLWGGVAWAYGNSEVVPYAEQFYIGGANSLRGFSIRSVGPGTYRAGGNRYAYMDQTGDVKLEANAELRFPVWGSLAGALFADAGNVWTLRAEADRPGGQFTPGTFMGRLATDVGLGLRYDLSMLVLRFDVGVPLHDPSAASTGRYYNIDGAFFANLGYHFAVGYPF